jgi:fibronectin type 3 domain-containing protein
MQKRRALVAILITMAFLMPVGLTFSTFNARADPVTGWSSVIVDNSVNQAEQYKDVKVDTAGHVHVVLSIGTNLWYWTNKTGPWISLSVDNSGTMGNYPSLAVDANGNAHIAYQVAIAGLTYVKYITNAPSGLLTTASFTANKATLLAAPSTEWNPILVEADGTPHVFTGYWDLWGPIYQGNITEYAKSGQTWTNTTVALGKSAAEMSAAWDGNDIVLMVNTNNDILSVKRTAGVWTNTIALPSVGTILSRLAVGVQSDHVINIAYWKWVSGGSSLYPLQYTNNSGTGFQGNLINISVGAATSDKQVAMDIWNDRPVVVFQNQRNIMMATPTTGANQIAIDAGGMTGNTYPGKQVAMAVKGDAVYIVHHGYPSSNPGNLIRQKLTLDVNLLLPGAPVNLRATAGDSVVHLRWGAASNNSGPEITAYNIYRGRSAGSEAYIGTTGTSALFYNDITVTNDQTYYYYVRAVGPSGSGDISNEIHLTPKALPGQPTITSAVPGDHSVLLTWSAAAPNGGAITSYSIYRSTISSQEVRLNQTAGSVLSLNDTQGLVNGVKYFYTVSAVNQNGYGPNSTETNATPLWYPNAPVLTATSDNRQVVLNWSAPADDGGAPVTNYAVYFGTSSSLTQIANISGSNLTYTETGLVNGNVYYFGVAAINSRGEGPMGTASSIPNTPPKAPSAPGDLTAVGGSGRIVLTWTASDQGSQPITDYKIFRGTTSTDLGYLDRTGSANVTYIDAGLMSGMAYYYQVVAVNSVGDSARSFAAQASSLMAPVAGAPANVSTVNVIPNDNSVNVSWAAPDPGNAPIIKYYVYRGEVDNSTMAKLVWSGSALSFTDTNVSNGKTYYYWVVATNSIGASESSASNAVSPSAKNNDSLLPIIVVVVIVIVLVVLFLFMRRRKAAPSGPGKGMAQYQQTELPQYRQQPASITGKCTKCGTPVGWEITSCPNCGKKLG